MTFLQYILKALLSFLFADETKCVRAVKTTDDFNTIQEDLDTDGDWSQHCSSWPEAISHHNHHEAKLLQSNLYVLRDY